MKYKDKYDIGEPVKIIYTNDIIEMLKVMSNGGTWINEVPKLFIEFLNKNYEASLEAIKYVPNLYFQLQPKFRNDRALIKRTIKAFKKYKRVDEIDTRFRPLVKKDLKVSAR